MFSKNLRFFKFWGPLREAFGPPNGIKIDEKSVLKNASFSDAVFYRNSMLFESIFDLHFDIFWCAFRGVSKKANPYETLAMRSKIKVRPSKNSSKCEPKSIKTALRKRIPKNRRKNAFWESFEASNTLRFGSLSRVKCESKKNNGKRGPQPHCKSRESDQAALQSDQKRYPIISSSLTCMTLTLSQAPNLLNP